jgi:hypothetical protein
MMIYAVENDDIDIAHFENRNDAENYAILMAKMSKLQNDPGYYSVRTIHVKPKGTRSEIHTEVQLIEPEDSHKYKLEKLFIESCEPTIKGCPF